MKALLTGDDCIGCLNFVNGKTYGFLCMDIPSQEKLKEMMSKLTGNLATI